MADLNEPNFCTRFNHGMDPGAGASSAGGDANWLFIANRGMTPTEMTYTPDRFTYQNFDFDGTVGNVINVN
jgi:hypothetical protein